MKVYIHAWFGQLLPFDLKPGEQEVSEDLFLKIFQDGHDVMLKHIPPPHQTKKGRDRDGLKPDGTPVLFLDLKYGGFRPR